MRRPKAKKKKDGLPDWKGVQEVRRIKHENMALRQAKIPCGKENCTKCPHGPYWYFVTWRGNEAKQRYIGKRLFGLRVKGLKDLETLILTVLRATGEKVAREEFAYDPEGVDVGEFTSAAA